MPALDAAEHIVEADVDYPGGGLAVYGPADDPGHEQHVTAPEPGRYRIRVSYLPSTPPSAVNEFELGDHFRYQITCGRPKRRPDSRSSNKAHADVGQF